MTRPRIHEPENDKARRLNTVLDSLGNTQFALADAMEVAPSTISGWRKRGSIDPDNLKKLCDKTGFRFLWVLFGEGDPRYDGQLRRDDGPLMEMIVAAVTKDPAYHQLFMMLAQAIQKDAISPDAAIKLQNFLELMLPSRSTTI